MYLYAQLGIVLNNRYGNSSEVLKFRPLQLAEAPLSSAMVKRSSDRGDNAGADFCPFRKRCRHDLSLITILDGDVAPQKDLSI